MLKKLFAAVKRVLWFDETTPRQEVFFIGAGYTITFIATVLLIERILKIF